MIANHRAEARITHEEIENLTILRTFRHQISHANNTVVRPEAGSLKHFDQLIVTTVNVSNYNRATHNPTCKYKSYSLSDPTRHYRCCRGQTRVSLHSTYWCWSQDRDSPGKQSCPSVRPHPRGRAGVTRNQTRDARRVLLVFCQQYRLCGSARKAPLIETPGSARTIPTLPTSKERTASESPPYPSALRPTRGQLQDKRAAPLSPSDR